MPSYLETARQIKEERSGRSHKVGAPAREPWDENQAFGLIRDALRRLDDHFIQYGENCWHDSALKAAVSAVRGSAHNRVTEAYVEEDMTALRVALRTYVEVGIEAFKCASNL